MPTDAQRRALAVLHRRLPVRFPRRPSLHARLFARVSYSRRLALSLRRIYPGRVTPRVRAGRGADAPAPRCGSGSAGAPPPLSSSPSTSRPFPAWLHDSFQCIHRFEGAWSSNTGNGYYGGLQMDLTFQSRYGPEFLVRWGTADNWPVWAQLQAAFRAYRSPGGDSRPGRIRPVSAV